LPWFNSYDNFRYYCGIIASRAYKSKIDEWERTKGVSLVSQPAGAKHKKFLEKLSPELTLSCLIPFFDLCNHRTPRNFEFDDKVDFILHWDKGGINIGLDDTFVPGKEYDYTYVPKAGNDKLTFVYGFHTNVNPHTAVSVIVTFARSYWTRDMYIACKELKCMELDLEGFYKRISFENEFKALLLYKALH
jgi:hypothetical protein